MGMFSRSQFFLSTPNIIFRLRSEDSQVRANKNLTVRQMFHANHLCRLYHPAWTKGIWFLLYGTTEQKPYPTFQSLLVSRFFLPEANFL